MLNFVSRQLPSEFAQVSVAALSIPYSFSVLNDSEINLFLCVNSDGKKRDRD
jgi:hypothetical protein